MFRIDMEITLTVQAPFMTQSSAPGPYGLDCVLARNKDGKMYIPGTLVTGHLREAWEELRDALGDDDTDEVPTAPDVNALLGDELTEGEYAPKTKDLFFSDFLLCGVAPSPGRRHRIEIDQQRGAVGKGQLMALEAPFESGKLLCFVGKLSFESRDEHKTPDKIRRQVRCGMQWISQMGAFRSIGFGRLKNVEMGPSVPKPIMTNAGLSSCDAAVGFDLILKPEGPFCIAQRPRAGNIFDSKEEIPGGVIRGCLARMISRLAGRSEQNRKLEEITRGTKLAALGENFSKIRITHAFPGNTCFTRPVKPPLSLVKADALYDAALLDGPALINGKAPDFSMDWKDHGDVNQLFGWPCLDRELRVRTAIDRQNLRKESEKLFAYDMIVPAGYCWLARVDLSAVDSNQREAVADQLAALFSHGLLGLGKSKVSVKTRLLPSGSVEDAHAIDQIENWMGIDALLVLTLQTPALLLDPAEMAAKKSAAALFKNYQTAFKGLTAALSLERFFARQSLSGGRYQHGRFQNNATYRPWLLTEAGSLFVFSVKQYDKAVQDVKKWLKTGLPFPPAVLKGYKLGDDTARLWEKCPFVPQNGYGEIAVNLNIHAEYCPEGEAFQPIERIENEEVNCE
jgi:hypothetical protein